jgi:hypothetical protein
MSKAVKFGRRARRAAIRIRANKKQRGAILGAQAALEVESLDLTTQPLFIGAFDHDDDPELEQEERDR